MRSSYAGAGVAAGLLLDRALGEPPESLHPVVCFGRVMDVVERRVWADDRTRGVLHAATGATVGLLAGRALERVLPRPAATAVAVGLAAAGRALRSRAAEVQALLDAEDLAGARAALPALVGRDPRDLDASQVSAAVVESLAENCVDAVVGPGLWGLVAGAPGALAYRAVNTMDAMVGHRSERYARYGWAAARLDDAAGLVPARVFAALVVLVRPGSAGEVLRLVRRDAPAHPSPNAGVAETAVAAALGRTLGGPLRYGARLEQRPRLGDGPRPAPADVARARALVDRAELALVALVLGLSLASHAAVPTRRRTRWA